MIRVIKDEKIGGLVIDRVTEQDLDRVLHIEQQSFSAPWTRKMFEAEISGNPFGYLLAARRIPDEGLPGELLGYVCFWVVFDELRLLNLAVDPLVRRQGIATELVRHALASGRSHGAGRACLEVRASNLAARALYERFGFRQHAVRARYYVNPVEDAVLMELDPLERKVEDKVEAQVLVKQKGCEDRR